MAAKEQGFYKLLNRFSAADEWREKDLLRRKKKKRNVCPGIFTVEAIWAVRQPKKNQEKEYLVKWDSWSSDFNSWEPESHILDKTLIQNFEKPAVVAKHINEHVELIRNTIESGLVGSLQTDVTIIFDHAVFRSIFYGKGRDCGRGTLAMGALDFQKKYFPQGWDRGCTNKRGTIREIIYPVHLRPFLARSRQLFSTDGSKEKRRWIQKLTISFRKRTV